MIDILKILLVDVAVAIGKKVLDDIKEVETSSNEERKPEYD